MDASGAQSTCSERTLLAVVSSMLRLVLSPATRRASQSQATARYALEIQAMLRLCSSRSILCVTADRAKVSYAELVEFFYRTHDPTQVDGQGPDIGTQYRSGLYPHTTEQEDTARHVTAKVQRERFDPNGTHIVTEIQTLPASDLCVHAYLFTCRRLPPRLSIQQPQWLPLPYSSTVVVTLCKMQK